ncbi:pyridoxamine 5'-phosphate oxidase family protein [Paenibacillus xanthanilyticus]|uniref:Pyridoxamine 5'-phosphate oxidase family protein n=1 Tax=Paenibacillus xanthanilyticus TaxID=1783531 RepID=A0ABV8K3W3_9BACL
MLTAAIRAAMEGIFPANIVTSSSEGVPNITLLSQVWYVDEEHIALSNQFLNKTRANLMGNPNAFLRMYSEDLRPFDLRIEYLRTETSGEVFKQMALRLEAIASYMGMQDVFALRGADIYKVLEARERTHYWQRPEEK